MTEGQRYADSDGFIYALAAGGETAGNAWATITVADRVEIAGAIYRLDPEDLERGTNGTPSALSVVASWGCGGDDTEAASLETVAAFCIMSIKAHQFLHPEEWHATVEAADTPHATASTAPDSHRSTSQTASTATKSRGTPYRPQGSTRAPVLTTAPIHRRRHRARPYARRSCTRGASTSTVDPPRPAASVPLIRSPRLSILDKGVTAIE